MQLSPYLRLKQSKLRLDLNSTFDSNIELNAWILVSYYDLLTETNIDSEQS